jgi:hypothetical protein
VTKFKSVRKALTAIWQKSKIDETAQRLKSIREALQFHVTCSTESKIDIMMARNEQEHEMLSQASQTIAAAMPELNDSITKFMSDQVRLLAVQRSEYEATAAQRHEETLGMLRKLGDAPTTMASRAPLVQKLDPSTVLSTIQDHLYFHQLSDRFDDIDEAHKKTFEWIFDPDATMDTSNSVNFNDWLHGDSRIYWVSGKAGSGKSTLMKYLMSRCEEPLKKWAGETPLVLLSFFSWNAGSDLQRSHQGLLQSLLHTALEEEPELGPILFPDQYGTTMDWQAFPSLHQLRRAFKELLYQTRIPLKVAVLIDGLDEFEEASDSEMKKLIEILRGGARSGHIKAILSSRPLALYEDAFEDDPKLRLHDLTHGDITTYVNDTLGRHKHMVRLRNADPEGAERLTSSLIDSASGVFMWVRLAAKNLLKGLQNYDTIPELQRRLDVLPRDLEALFEHMLQSIPPEYRKESSCIFQTIRHVGSDLTACELYFSDFSLDAVLRAETSPLSDLRVQDIQSNVEGRLRSRCFGLVELRPRSLGIEHDSGVSYLHKTVADFLYRSDIWAQIEEQTKDTDFSPNNAMLKATIMIAKVLPPESAFERPGYRPLLRSIDEYAKAEELRTGSANESLLDEIDRTMTFQAKKLNDADRDSLNDWCELLPREFFGSSPIPNYPNFLSWCIMSGLETYVVTKIRQNGHHLLDQMGDRLLQYCGCYSCWVPGGAYPSIVQALLENGANPNGAWEKRLMFTMDIDQEFIDLPIAEPYSYPVPPNKALQWISIMRLLVVHGADPNVVVCYGSGTKWNYDMKTSVICLVENYSAILLSQLGEKEMVDTGIQAEVDALTKLLKEKMATVVHEEMIGDEWVPAPCRHRVIEDTKACEPAAQDTAVVTVQELKVPSAGSLKLRKEGSSKKRRFLSKLSRAISS